MDKLTELIYTLSLDGWGECFGDVQSAFDHNTLIKGKRYWFYLCEDNYGFKWVDVIRPEDQPAFQLKWDHKQDEYNLWCEAQEQGLYHEAVDSN